MSTICVQCRRPVEWPPKDYKCPFCGSNGFTAAPDAYWIPKEQYDALESDLQRWKDDYSQYVQEAKEQYDALQARYDAARLSAHIHSDHEIWIDDKHPEHFGCRTCLAAEQVEAEVGRLREALGHMRDAARHWVRQDCEVGCQGCFDALDAMKEAEALLAEPAAPQPEDVCTRPDCRDCEVCPRILAEYDKHQYDEIFADEVYTILADAYPDRVQLPQFDNECADCEVEFGLSEAIISVGDRRYHESCAPSEKARKNPQDPA